MYRSVAGSCPGAHVWLGLWAAATLAACAPDPTPGCVPGRTNLCTCGTLVGVQACRQDRIYEPCKCAPAGADLGAAADLSAAGDLAGVRRRVFITSSRQSGNLRGTAQSGLEGADRICTTAATTAGLGGAWRAWLSDSKTNAIDRLVDVGPWYLVNGQTRVFGGRTAIPQGPQRVIDMDEQGRQLAAQPNEVWTGTRGTGLRATQTCNDWATGVSTERGLYGEHDRAERWTDAGDGGTASHACNSQHYLYCFEQ